VPQVGDGAVMQALLVGMAPGPGPLLPVNLLTFAGIGLSMALGDHRFVATTILLAAAHPGDIAGLVAGRSGVLGHDETESMDSVCSRYYQN